ncbi:hypothetical protein M9H77_36683 [Catharanthus roseus]|uniref:Uncharacterized protein n=1 Tax=Catharanthus roseus TaxID=4058 RepID=A0ACB9ZUG7_CATRO|nr:hypothetical protein M9H77_36683 [Catharanthus roseus]
MFKIVVIHKFPLFWIQGQEGTFGSMDPGSVYSFGGCTTDRGNLSLTTDLGVVAYTCIEASIDYECSGRPSCSSWRYMFIWLPYFDRALVPSDLWRAETYWGTQHAIHVQAWLQWLLRIRDGPALAAEVLSYPSDEYIRWYRGITRVYIGNQLSVIPKWQTYTLSCSHVLAVCRENMSRTDTYVLEIYSRQTYRRTYQANFHPVLSENFWRDVPFNLTFYSPNMKNEWGRK